MSWVNDMTRYQIRVEDGAMPGLCFDIDGYWWNGHGPGSKCPHCDPEEPPPFTGDPTAVRLWNEGK